MAYTPNPDDAAAPLDTGYASSAALEFRTLKAKVNQLFLSSNINTAENAIYSTKGLALVNSGGTTSDQLFGVLGSASRTGGSGAVLGMYASATLGDTVTLASGAAHNGLLVEAFTGSTDSICGDGGIVGARVITVQRNNVGQDAVIGLISRFQNRISSLDGGAVVGGAGDDLYNVNSKAISIQSQRRSTESEKCGWAKGIVFEDYSLDDDDNTAAHPCAIDFTGLDSYDSSRRPVPFEFGAGSLETVAVTNSGSVVMPTVLLGVLRFNVDGAGTYGIPVVSLAALP